MDLPCIEFVVRRKNCSSVDPKVFNKDKNLSNVKNTKNMDTHGTGCLVIRLCCASNTHTRIYNTYTHRERIEVKVCTHIYTHTYTYYRLGLSSPVPIVLPGIAITTYSVYIHTKK